MHRRKSLIVLLICGTGYFSACFFSSSDNKSMKDLDQHMLDLRIYHENLGDALLSKNYDYAMWFVHDMDSILKVVSNEFATHRKLHKPFKHYYKKNLTPYLKDLESEIESKDWKHAIKSYSILTTKCNDCHIDHDIDKEVRDPTKQ